MRIFPSLLVATALLVAHTSTALSQDERQRRKLSFGGVTISAVVGEEVEKRTSPSGADWTFSTGRSVHVVVTSELDQDARTLSQQAIQRRLDEAVERVLSAKGGERVKDTRGTWEGHPTRMVVLAEVPNTGGGVVAIRALLVGSTLWAFFWSPNGSPSEVEVLEEKYFPQMRAFLNSVRVVQE